MFTVRVTVDGRMTARNRTVAPPALRVIEVSGMAEENPSCLTESTKISVAVVRTVSVSVGSSNVTTIALGVPVLTTGSNPANTIAVPPTVMVPESRPSGR